MKIIGQTRNGFILEADTNEINSLLALSDSRKGKAADVPVGTELTFTTALTNLNLIKDLSLTSDYRTLYELKQAKVEIDKAIDIVEKLKIPLIEIQKEIKVRQQ